jgi:serine/threonine-protein kinase
MAPEQIKGERVDEGADIYSIGVTLFEMVSGRPPFEADSAMTTMMMHLNDPVPDLRQIQPGTPPELVAIIEKALAKNRSQRYASAAEMSTALRKILDRMYSAAAGATLVSEAMPPETGVPAEPLDATLKAPGAGQVLPVPVAAKPFESEPTPAEATIKAAGGAIAAGAAAAPPAGQAPTVMTPAGSGTPPPPPVSTPYPASAAAEPPQKRSFSPAMLAGGAATILILLVIIFVAGQNLLGGDKETPATEPVATLPAAAQETAAPTHTATATSVPPTNTPPPTATTKPSATPTTAPTPTETPSTEPYVEITGITILKDVNGYPTNYSIDYTTENFTESHTGYHIHFFFNTVPPDKAGLPAGGPWELHYGPRPFIPDQQMMLKNRPPQATQICALVANSNHTLYYPPSGQLTTGNCWDIPPY